MLKLKIDALRDDVAGRRQAVYQQFVSQCVSTSRLRG